MSYVRINAALAVQRSLSSDEDKAAARDLKAHDLLILLPTHHNPLLFIWVPHPEAGTGDEKRSGAGATSRGDPTAERQARGPR